MVDIIVNIEKDLELFTTKELRKLALAVDTAIVLSTPVDTGAARSNWLPSVNNPIETISETLDPSGQSSIDNMKSVSNSAKFGDDIWITNNLPYIGRLNDGYSLQAPAGFVEKAVQIVKSGFIK